MKRPGAARHALDPAQPAAHGAYHARAAGVYQRGGREAIVGHMPKDIVATYNAHTYDAERLEWLAKLDRHLEWLAGSHTQ